MKHDLRNERKCSRTSLDRQGREQKNDSPTIDSGAVPRRVSNESASSEDQFFTPTSTNDNDSCNFLAEQNRVQRSDSIGASNRRSIVDVAHLEGEQCERDDKDRGRSNEPYPEWDEETEAELVEVLKRSRAHLHRIKDELADLDRLVEATIGYASARQGDEREALLRHVKTIMQWQVQLVEQKTCLKMKLLSLKSLCDSSPQ